MRRVVIIILVILAAWNIILTVNLMNLSKGEKETEETVIKELSTEFETDYTELVELVSNKVVGVVTHGVYSDTYGSGVIYGQLEDGGILIVTSNHILSSNEVYVYFANRAEVEAEIIGGDTLSDIALLLVYPSFHVEPLNIGDSSVVKEGEWILTVGSKTSTDFNPYYNQGIISSKNRIGRKASSEMGINDYDVRMIQTTAVIDSASVGGALVNMNGDLIGILNSTSSMTESYAVESNEIKLVCAELLEKQEVDRTLLGFFAKDLNDLPLYMKSYYGIDLSVENGIVVTEVSEGSMAESMGLKIGDVITAINEMPVTSYTDYRIWVYQNENTNITLEVHSGMEVNRLNAELVIPEAEVVEEEND